MNFSFLLAYILLEKTRYHRQSSQNHDSRDKYLGINDQRATRYLIISNPTFSKYIRLGESRAANRSGDITFFLHMRFEYFKRSLQNRGASYHID
jgi:hypothetical protein